jgi:hypothetical protein
MLLILRMHKVRNERLADVGLEMHIADARGPMTGILPAGGYHVAEDGCYTETGKSVIHS